MDIQIVDAFEDPTDSRFFVIHRTLDGLMHAHRLPKETLAIRAAEYDLDPDDARAFDIIMLEPFLHEEDMDEKVPPLYTAQSVQAALAIVMSRTQRAKSMHGAPRGDDGVLAKAAKAEDASPGLVKAHALLSEFKDDRMVAAIKTVRDSIRNEVARGPRRLAKPSFADQILSHAESHKRAAEPVSLPSSRPNR